MVAPATVVPSKRSSFPLLAMVSLRIGFPTRDPVVLSEILLWIVRLLCGWHYKGRVQGLVSSLRADPGGCELLKEESRE